MKDWRIDNVKNLRGLSLQRQPWTRWSESWDHDHCSACWAKFGDGDDVALQKEGYATRDDYEKGARYEWVCVRCFNELKDEMGWTDAPLS